MIPIGEPFRSESEAIHLSAVWKAAGRDEETRWLQSDKRLFVVFYPLVLCRMNIKRVRNGFTVIPHPKFMQLTYNKSRKRFLCLI